MLEMKVCMNHASHILCLALYPVILTILFSTFEKICLPYCLSNLSYMLNKTFTSKSAYQKSSLHHPQVTGKKSTKQKLCCYKVMTIQVCQINVHTLL